MAPRFTLIALTTVLLALAGCAGNPDTKTQSSDDTPGLGSGPWQLVAWTLESPPIPEGVSATLAIDEGAETATGAAGCNSFSGAWSREGAKLALGPFILTKKMCMEPEGVMAFEQAYMATLEASTAYTFNGPQLVLHTEDGSRLVFAPEASRGAKKTNGDLASLQQHVGEYPRDIDLWNAPALSARLKALLGDAWPAFAANMEVQGPLSEEDGLLYVTGNKAHEGGSEMAALVVSPVRDQLQVWLVRDGQAKSFVEKQPPLPDPADVQALKANLESAP